MIKIITAERSKIKTIPMSKMKPLQVGVVTSDVFKGHYVMRTQNSVEFEVMDLSHPGADEHFDCDGADPRVRLLAPGEKIVLELYNEEE